MAERAFADASRPLFGRVSALLILANDAYQAERERWALWLPAVAGLGIILYFSLDHEPPPWLGPSVWLLLTVLLLLFRRSFWSMTIVAAALAAATGFALAQARTAGVEAPMLNRETGPVFVEGRVVGQDILPAGVRVMLDRVAIEGLTAAETPRLVRVRLTRSSRPLPTGGRVKVLAVLNGPSPPAMPGAYDFRRHAFFQGIGGIGYAVGAAELLDAPEVGDPVLELESWRREIGERVHAVLDGDEAAIAEALLNGERAAISDETNAVMRDSGLAHLLSISGLHIGLVAGIAFTGLRLLLSLSETIALRHPIKKWAAVAALLVTFFYTMMVGAPVPTQRSFLMTGIVLLAVVLDRTALSMRLVAWAAAIVLAVAPESLLGPSFQMSFGAVIALIAFYENGRERFASWHSGGGWGRVALLYVAGVALTSLVASAATTPFAAYHFQRVATYGLPANLVAVPVTSFWVMPWALAFYLLVPFGLEEMALVPMEWGIGAIIAVAETTAGWPGAVFTISAIPDWGMAAFALGGLWICLWQGRWRRLGALALVAGLASATVPERPDILVNEDGQLMAVRDESGALTVSSLRKDRFARNIWLARNGQVDGEPWPAVGPSADGGLICDPLGCLYRRQGRTIALIRHPAAFAEDCPIADVVVASIPAPWACRAPLVIDRFDVWRRGAYALTVSSSGVRAESVADRVGDRPWSLRR